MLTSGVKQLIYYFYSNTNFSHVTWQDACVLTPAIGRKLGAVLHAIVLLVDGVVFLYIIDDRNSCAGR